MAKWRRTKIAQLGRGDAFARPRPTQFARRLHFWAKGVALVAAIAQTKFPIATKIQVLPSNCPIMTGAFGHGLGRMEGNFSFSATEFSLMHC